MSAVNEQELIELQMQLAFQEDLLENLNQALSSQQQEILMLKSQLEFLAKEMQSYKQQSQQSDGFQRLLENERPPHY